MRDRLEDFIKDHREEFDFNVPDPKLWQGIEKNINKTRSVNIRFYLSRAAIIILVAGVTFFAQRYYFMNKDLFVAKNDTTANDEVIIPELMEAEAYYTGMVNEKLEQLQPELKENPTLEKELRNDLSELDSVYQNLKNDLKDDVANQEVIEAMIQNYRLRVSILEDMLDYLNEDNKDDNSNLHKHDL